ncbi:MAG: glycosyltransferase family 2 protein [Isosphaeraceae bacterium]|nr:glycosyltransferase family 2 protein [Isosphaeraceae bacterium]
MASRNDVDSLAGDGLRISVILPVYSETETVREIVAWLGKNLAGRLEEVIIVLSPRSGEASSAVCRELAASNPSVRLHVQERNPGLGFAVREGLALVRGNAVLLMDSDGEMEIETIPRMVTALTEGHCDLVVASRWIKGGGFSGYDPLKAKLNWAFQQVFRLLYGTSIHDLTYGFKLMRTEIVRRIEWEGTLHEIACETTLKPLSLGYRLGEVPSRWTARTQGVSKNTFLRNFRYVAMALKVLVHGVPPRAVVPVSDAI